MYSKKIDFIRSHPISTDDGYLPITFIGRHVYKTRSHLEISYTFSDNDYYFYAIDNVPFVKLDLRDKLILETTFNYNVVSYKSRSNFPSSLLSKEIFPVVLDTENEVIHRSFSEITKSNSVLAFVIKNHDTGQTYYEENGEKYFYVVFSTDNIILSYDDFVDLPNTTVQKNTLVSEKESLYISTDSKSYGSFCTNNLINKLKDVNNKYIKVGSIKTNYTSISKVICGFSSDGLFGASQYLPDKYHHEFLDIKENLQTRTLDGIVYDHNGSLQKIEKVSRSLVSGTLDTNLALRLQPTGLFSTTNVTYNYNSFIQTTVNNFRDLYYKIYNADQILNYLH